MPGRASGCKNPCFKTRMKNTTEKGHRTARGTARVVLRTREEQKRARTEETAGRGRDSTFALTVEGAAPVRHNDEPNKPDRLRGLKLRVGTVNVGTMARRSGEIVDMVARRKLDFCCVQETRWKGGSARTMGVDGGRYKFFWVGCEEGVSGVGVLVSEKWIDKVIEVKRVSERMMVLRVIIGRSVLNLVTVYAPQVGRPQTEKEEFFIMLGRELLEIGIGERVVVCGDLNGHVGREADGYEGVHGGFGWGERNQEGEMLLEFADAMEMVVANTCFTKDTTKLVTFESGGNKTVVDYVLVRKSDRAMVKDVKVIRGEPCIPQHKLLVCVLIVDNHVKSRNKDFVSKCKVWKLKEAEVQGDFYERVRERASKRAEGEDVEELWKGLKDSLKGAADEACGRTKGPPRHKETWWWNAETAEVVAEKRRMYGIWKTTKEEKDKVAYQQIKVRAKRVIAKAQAEERQKFGEMLEREDEQRKVFRVAKQIIGKNKDVVGGGCIKDENGKIVVEDEQIKEVWKKYFEKLLNEEFSWDRDKLDAVNAVSGPCERISLAEVKVAIAKAKTGKAAGPSGVVVDMVKAAGDVGEQWVTDICNAVVRDGHIPDDWKKSWMVSVYKGKGNALECGSYRGIKLLDQVHKILERVIEARIRNRVNLDEMQFGFRPGRGTTDAIFIVRQVQEKFLAKHKEVWMAFIDLEKAFDRVPREVLWWALRHVGVEEWIVNIIKAMYDGATTSIKLSSGVSQEFEVKVGVHQGSVLSPLLFIIVMQALSDKFKEGLPWELLYADDLSLIAESEEKLMDKIMRWKTGMEEKGLRVNLGKTKILKCQGGVGQVEDSGKWPCGVCRKGVGSNSIKCTGCKKWIHKRCSGVKGNRQDSLEFLCQKCIDGLKGGEEVVREFVLETGDKLEIVDRFCYLGDMIGKGGGAEEASITRARCAWSKFRELLPLLVGKGASLNLKGKIYKACVQRVLVYGSETWAMKVEDMRRLERTERMMIRWMCGVTLKNSTSSQELRERLHVDCVTEVVRRGRLRWFGHVERKEKDDWVAACRDLVIDGTKGKGRGRKTWVECVKDDLKELGLKKEYTMDRELWKNLTSGKRLTRTSMEKRTLKRR